MTTTQVTVNLSEQELEEIVQAYQTIQAFLHKVISPNELYYDEFINGLREAQSEVEAEQYETVKHFDDFIR